MVFFCQWNRPLKSCRIWYMGDQRKNSVPRKSECHWLSLPCVLKVNIVAKKGKYHYFTMGKCAAKGI